MHRGPGVVTCFHCDHEQRHEKEEDCHGEADAVDRSVPHKEVAAHEAVHMRHPSVKPLIAKSGNLRKDTFSCEFPSAFKRSKS